MGYLTRKFSKEHFDTMLTTGGCVPRYRSGDIITGEVGRTYEVECRETGRKVLAKVTQSSPHHYIPVGEVKEPTA